MTEAESSTPRAPGEVVFAFANYVLRELARAVELGGERTGFAQIYDANPGDESTNMETHYEMLEVDTARRTVVERIKSGFDGIAGFSCLVPTASGSLLRVEGWDTRTHTGVVLGLPMKRTMFGRFKPSAIGEVLGGASELASMLAAHSGEKN